MIPSARLEEFNNDCVEHAYVMIASFLARAFVSLQPTLHPLGARSARDRTAIRALSKIALMASPCS
jgi:hypothetical protein